MSSKWYNTMSNFYDISLEKLYFDSRKRAVELLDIQSGQSILDIACGTGANFSHIQSCNSNIDLYGTDFSSGMLQKAESKIKQNDWKNITLFQSDARLLSPELIKKQTHKDIRFDRIICVLGLSVIPDWENAFDKMLALLSENGKIVIVDVFVEKPTFSSWMVGKIAQADMKRKIWQKLKANTNQFILEYQPIKEYKIGGKLFVAKGEK